MDAISIIIILQKVFVFSMILIVLCTYVCVFMCLCICTCVYVCIVYVFVCVYVHVCIYVCMYAHKETYIYSCTSNLWISLLVFKTKSTY